VAEEPAAADQSGMKHTFTASPGTLNRLDQLDPVALGDIQLVAFHNWDTTREPLTSVAPDEGRFTTRRQPMQTWNPSKRDSLFFLENYLSALDAPGEWFLARDGWLYYAPRPGEDMASAQVVAPIAPGFLSIHGTVANTNEWVQHLRFQGLTFRFAEYRV